MTDAKARLGTHHLSRKSLPEALAASLRERILNGEFRDGDALVQETIAAEYDCSRMPVREALRQLEAEGLIVSRMHRGAVVTSLPDDQILELFELRAMLEADILSHALGNVRDMDFEHAARILDDLEDAYGRRDIARVGALNWEFHRSLYLAARRPQTLALIQGVHVQTDRYIRLQLLLTAAFADAAREHRDILRLCHQRDSKAVAYLRTHILTAGHNLIAALVARREGEPNA